MNEVFGLYTTVWQIVAKRLSSALFRTACLEPMNAALAGWPPASPWSAFWWALHSWPLRLVSAEAADRSVHPISQSIQ
jgi:hypothetical protein